MVTAEAPQVEQSVAKAPSPEKRSFMKGGKDLLKSAAKKVGFIRESNKGKLKAAEASIAAVAAGTINEVVEAPKKLDPGILAAQERAGTLKSLPNDPEDARKTGDAGEMQDAIAANAHTNGSVDGSPRTHKSTELSEETAAKIKAEAQQMVAEIVARTGPGGGRLATIDRSEPPQTVPAAEPLSASAAADIAQRTVEWSNQNGIGQPAPKEQPPIGTQAIAIREQPGALVRQESPAVEVPNGQDNTTPIDQIAPGITQSVEDWRRQQSVSDAEEPEQPAGTQALAVRETPGALAHQRVAVSGEVIPPPSADFSHLDGAAARTQAWVDQGQPGQQEDHVSTGNQSIAVREEPSGVIDGQVISASSNRIDDGQGGEEDPYNDPGYDAARARDFDDGSEPPVGQPEEPLSDEEGNEGGGRYSVPPGADRPAAMDIRGGIPLPVDASVIVDPVDARPADGGRDAWRQVVGSTRNALSRARNRWRRNNTPPIPVDASASFTPPLSEVEQADQLVAARARRSPATPEQAAAARGYQLDSAAATANSDRVAAAQAEARSPEAAKAFAEKKAQEAEVKRVRATLEGKGFPTETVDDPLYQQALQDLEGVVESGQRPQKITRAEIEDRVVQLKQEQAEAKVKQAQDAQTEKETGEETEAQRYQRVLDAHPELTGVLKQPEGYAGATARAEARTRTTAEQAAQQQKWAQIAETYAPDFEAHLMEAEDFPDGDVEGIKKAIKDRADALQKKADEDAKAAKPRGRNRKGTSRAKTGKAAKVTSTVSESSESSQADGDTVAQATEDRIQQDIAEQVAMGIDPDVAEQLIRGQAGVEAPVAPVAPEPGVAAVDTEEPSESEAAIAAAEAIANGRESAESEEAAVESDADRITRLEAENARLQTELTATVAAQGEQIAELTQQLKDLSDPTKILEKLPPELQAALKKLMEKKPEGEETDARTALLVALLKMILGAGGAAVDDLKEAVGAK